MRLAKRRKVRPDDPVAVVTRFLDAANHHDADGLRACVHPEFESFQPLHPARNFRGAGQLISNWRAIFEAEPGFRLTLLRASTTGNTVWAEVHGAGASAEAAGIFIVGVENARIRWIRVYSDLVEPLPEEAVEEAPAAETPGIDWDRDPIRLVPPRPPEAADGEEPEAAPEKTEEPEVAVAGGEAPSLRLVGSEPADEELPTPPAEAETPQVADAPAGPAAPGEATGGEVAGGHAAEATDAIEVLVGDAPAVEVDGEVEEQAPAPQPPASEAADAAAEVSEAGAGEVRSEAGAGAPADGEGQDGEEPGTAALDTVARFGGAAPEPPADDGASPPPQGRRRRGFLRRGGAR
ncbi:MAG TPA: nuclear transport factor 2 family protein [Acidimicrobiales bacterium]|nr:nuclear transport factor 2 family protein [Acidimicrobiales bacterium]